MPRLYMLTVPGLEVKSDRAAVHDCLVDEFPQVIDVLATTMAATLLIVYEGEADVDAWLDRVSEAILSRRISAGSRTRVTPPIRGPRARADIHEPAGKEASSWSLI